LFSLYPELTKLLAKTSLALAHLHYWDAWPGFEPLPAVQVPIMARHPNGDPVWISVTKIIFLIFLSGQLPGPPVTIKLKMVMTN
jgi:hypothetical protein